LNYVIAMCRDGKMDIFVELNIFLYGPGTCVICKYCGGMCWPVWLKLKKKKNSLFILFIYKVLLTSAPGVL